MEKTQKANYKEDPQQINYMPNPVKFLRDSGLLFSINKNVLHPLGLAIGLIVKENDNSTTAKFNLWDYRDGLEGILFEEETFKQGAKKLKAFMKKSGDKKLQKRRKLLGFEKQKIKK